MTPNAIVVSPETTVHQAPKSQRVADVLSSRHASSLLNTNILISTYQCSRIESAIYQPRMYVTQTIYSV